MICRAFAPANGSLIFQTYEAGPNHGRGSLGVGFTLDGGVRVAVSRLEDAPVKGQDTGDHAAMSEILVAAEAWDFPTVRQVIRELAAVPVRVEIEADFPFGCGFGMSGASALATAYALGELLGLPHSQRALALVAHEAEVQHATGRGDVGGQCNGGFMMKTRIGAPLDVELLPIPETTVWCRVFGPLSTREVLRDEDTMARVNQAGGEALAHLRALPELDLEALLFVSREFAETSGLLVSPRVRQAIAEAEQAGGRASMVMLGEAVVSSVPIAGARAWRVVKRPAQTFQHLNELAHPALV